MVENTGELANQLKKLWLKKLCEVHSNICIVGNHFLRSNALFWTEYLWF